MTQNPISEDIAEAFAQAEESPNVCESCGEECDDLHECTDGLTRCENCAFQCCFCEEWLDNQAQCTDKYNDEPYCESCNGDVCEECGGFQECNEDCHCESCREAAYENSINEGYI